MPSTTNKKASTKGKKDAPVKTAAHKKSPIAASKKKPAPKADARKSARAKSAVSGKNAATSKSSAKPTVVVKASASKITPMSAPTKPTAQKTVPAKVASSAKPGKPAAAAPKASGGKPVAAPVKAAPAKEARTASSATLNGSAAKPAPVAATVAADDKKGPAKGITVVQNKPMRKPKIKVKVQMPSDPLFKPGSKWKPLIPSGPNATPTGMANLHAHGHANEVKPVFKTKLTKKELEPYRKILLSKRSELVGDIAHMEDEALRQSSGSLSQLPQHMAEQGSDTFEQSLSLDLAAVDRSLIREIDDALRRIEEGTYGMCERTGKPINAVRLAELPWARYSIEAARELERRPYQE